jgi:HAD superfamily hydrolase (TIGR01509 family)
VIGRPPAAVVFDCDGLLVETESRWTIAEQALLAAYGGTWSDELKLRMLGTGLSRSAVMLAEAAGRPASDAPAVGAELLQRFGATLDEHGVEPMPGAAELIALLRGRVRMAVASNTLAPLVAQALRLSGLQTEAFEFVVCAGGPLAEKPQPDVYRESCRLLSVDPGAAVAFEDSQTGVAAARAAGMTVVGVPSLGVHLDADVVVASLLEVDGRTLGLV